MNKAYNQIINEIYDTIKSEENPGKTADYIPELAKIDKNKFAVCLKTLDGQQFCAGDYQESFSIQSISKVLILSLVYRTVGEEIWKRVDVEPSGNPFNSLYQLEADKGIPRNPFINAGALVMCDILLDLSNNPKQYFLDFMVEISGLKNINYSEDIAISEIKNAYRNTALTNFIKSLGNINNNPNDVLDLYCYICSLKLTCKELCTTFSF